MGLVRARYNTLNTYVKMLKMGNAPQNYSSSSSIKLSASFQGIGPGFKLLITIDNAGEKPQTNCDLIINYDEKVFSFEKKSIKLAIVLPNVPLTYAINFRNVSDSGKSGLLKVSIVKKNETVPLITNILKVPISEIELI